LLDLLCHHLGIILVIIHLLIIVVCTWIHIWFNILLHTQVVVHCKGRLFVITIWSKIMYVLLLRKVKNSNHQNSKEMQPRWCPSGLSNTYKRRLQRLHKRGAMEQQIEEKPVKSTRTLKEWRQKQVSTST
jgi:hypothetical protein